MFRRPLLSLLSDVFHEGEQCGRKDIFQLSTGCKQELLMLCIFAPFAYSNLRAEPLDKIFCSDASLAGSGVCVAEINKKVCLELCRVAEQRGTYTRIDNSALRAFQALHGDDIVGPCHIPQSLSDGFVWDFCEIFRGTGRLSAAHQSRGCRVHLGFDIADGARGDVLLPSTFSAIIGLLCRRVVRAWHVAPVCTTFGTLKRPQVRSKLEPFGFDPSEPATYKGNQFAMRGGFILYLCLYYNLVVSIEQPGSSIMFRLDIYKRLLARGLVSIKFPFCSWGTPFEKMSWWLGNNPLFAKLSGQCQCGFKRDHFRVRGVFDESRRTKFIALCRPSVEAVFGRAPRLNEHVAKFATGYPIPLCDKVADLNCIHFQNHDSENDDIARPFSSPARWIGQLGRSLRWKNCCNMNFTVQITSTSTRICHIAVC